MRDTLRLQLTCTQRQENRLQLGCSGTRTACTVARGGTRLQRPMTHHPQSNRDFPNTYVRFWEDSVGGYTKAEATKALTAARSLGSTV